MLHAWKFEYFGAPATVVSSAETYNEFKMWGTNMENKKDKDLFTEMVVSNGLTNCMTKGLQDFKGTLYLFLHETEEQRSEFFTSNNFIEVFGNAVEFHDGMYMEKDMEESLEDTRTIGEILGEDENYTPVEEDEDIERTVNEDGSIKTPEWDEDSSLVVESVKVDASGNIEVNAQSLTDAEVEERKKAIKKAKDKFNSKQENVKQEAINVGLDPDMPNTKTILKPTGDLIQINMNTGVVKVIMKNGTVYYSDMETNQQLTEREVKKKEIEAELKKLEKEEQEEQRLAEEALKEKERQQQKIKEIMEVPEVEEESEKEELSDEEKVTKLTGDIYSEVKKGISLKKFKELFGDADIQEDLMKTLLSNYPSIESEVEPDFISVRKIANLLDELNKIFKKSDNQNNINRTNTPKKDKKSNKEYYFAVVPPGELNIDTNATLIGTKAYAIIAPKEEVDSKQFTEQSGNWFTKEELEDASKATGVEVEEVAPSVYQFNCNVGNMVRILESSGTIENGILLVERGVDLASIPFDWPGQYHASGRRVNKLELYRMAIRVLLAAQEQGMVLKDETGEIKVKAAGINQEALEDEGEDITHKVKDILSNLGDVGK